MNLVVTDLGRMPYRKAWEIQRQTHANVAEGSAETLFLVEHHPVITLGRRPDSQRNLLSPEDQLATLGVELVQSDRGGDITFHGPGQLVAYPIIRLNDHHLSIGGYVHRLEAILIQTLKDFDIEAFADPKAVGVWTHDPSAGQTAKIAAIGVRIRRGVSMHGMALNVQTDLNYFNLIIPCGLVERPVTSLQKILGSESPPMDLVKQALLRNFRQAMGFENKH